MNDSSVCLNGSIIEDSPLFGQFGWPEDEPDLSSNLVTMSQGARAIICSQCAEAIALPSKEWWESRNQDMYSIELTVRDYLNHRLLQFNSRNIFSSCDNIPIRIRTAIEKNGEIVVILPVFCVISSWQKRHHVTSTTFAEEVSLLHLARVARHLKEMCGVALKFKLISDATFYANIFGDPIDAAKRYIIDLRALTVKHGIRDEVEIHDMSSIVSSSRRDYNTILREHLSSYERNPSLGISIDETYRFTASVGSTVNIEDFNLTYEQRRSIFCDSAFPSSAVRKQIMDRISHAFINYRAMKAAMSDLQWEMDMYPDALRGTIHHKTMPVLGVRIYPSYKRHSSQLPYHGIAVVTKKGDTWQMTIEPEINQRSNVLRVAKSDNVSDFYIDRSSFSKLG